MALTGSPGMSLLMLKSMMVIQISTGINIKILLMMYRSWFDILPSARYENGGGANPSPLLGHYA